jgi:hypothetical protein
VEQLVEALRYKYKVAGSIPDGVTQIFHWLWPTGELLRQKQTNKGV